MDNWRPNPAPPQLWDRCRDAARAAGVALDWNGERFVIGRWPQWTFDFYDTPTAVAAALGVVTLMDEQTPTSLKAPFPYFGGKSRTAAEVWARFGNVQNYVEPFFGSGAVLLGCPWPGHTETVNDADGLLANFWRALQLAPDEVAHYADYPVSELDLHARHRWLVAARPRVEALLEDPDAYDAKAAGWWVWGISQWIGSGWCDTGRERKLPSLAAGDGSDGQKGIHSKTFGTHRKRPHLGGTNTNADGTPGKSSGKGVEDTKRREPEGSDPCE